MEPVAARPHARECLAVLAVHDASLPRLFAGLQGMVVARCEDCAAPDLAAPASPAGTTTGGASVLLSVTSTPPISIFVCRQVLGGPYYTTAGRPGLGSHRTLGWGGGKGGRFKVGHD